MTDEIADMIEAGCFEIELLFIEWEYKTQKLFTNQNN